MTDGPTTADPPPISLDEKSYLLLPGYNKTDLIEEIAKGEDEAMKRFAIARWGKDWQVTQTCPSCQKAATHFKYESKWRWKCRETACGSQFTVLSGTRLHGAKMPALKLLSIFIHFVEAKDSVSARELSGLHRLNHQTMHVLLLKIREAIADTMKAEPPLSGLIQADAAYFIKYVRPLNIGMGAAAAAKRAQQNAGLDQNGSRQPSKYVHPNMHALVVFAEWAPQGQRRYKVAKIKTESQLDLRAVGTRYCTVGSVLITDQADAYNEYGWIFDRREVVNHTKQFARPDGVHTNLAEGFFSRVRAAQAGAWHRMSIQYLEYYGWEIAWRLTMVGKSNDVQLADLLRILLTSGRPSQFVDYWDKRDAKDRLRSEDVGPAIEVKKSELEKKMGRPRKGSLRVMTARAALEKLVKARDAAPAQPAAADTTIPPKQA